MGTELYIYKLQINLQCQSLSYFFERYSFQGVVEELQHRFDNQTVLEI